jgi:hypothetical protein
MEAISLSEKKNESLVTEKVERCHKIDLFWCVFTRIVFLAQSIYVTLNLVMYKNNFCFGLLFIGVLAIIVDGAFIITKRNGKEHLWFVS